MRIETAIQEFLTFLKSPIYNYKMEQPLDFSTATKLYFLVFLFEMLLFIPVSALIGIDTMPHAMQDLMANQSWYFIVAMVIFLAPIAEEFMFRYHLRYGTFTFLYMILVLVGIGLLLMPDRFPLLMESFSVDSFLVLLGENMFVGPLILTILMAFFLLLHYLEKGSIKPFITKGFPLIFYISALVFALVHVSNFTMDKRQWYLAPFMVLPQFILALYLGYIRIRNNLGYSIYIHALNNSIPIMLYYLASFTLDS